LLRLVLCSLILCFLSGCSDPRCEREKVRDRILIQFSKQMQKKGLYAAGLGGGCTINKKINLIDVSFDYDEVMDLDSARKLIVESTKHLLDLINSDGNIKEYFEVFPVDVDILSISIMGQIPDSSRDYIRLVFVLKGIVYYYTDDPAGKVMPFLDVHEETFEEAKKIVSKKNET